MDIAALLNDLLKLIPTARHWTKKQYAANIDGEERHFTAPDACRFCIMGGLYRLQMDKSNPRYRQACIDTAARFLQPFCGDCGITGFNDKSTHAQVVEMLRNAIDRARIMQTLLVNNAD